MNKEEALDRYTFGITDYVGYWPEEPVELAMDLYAKQQAIAFGKWTAINLWSVHGDNWYPYMDEDNPITGDELYTLFIEQQNKEK